VNEPEQIVVGTNTGRLADVGQPARRVLLNEQRQRVLNFEHSTAFRIWESVLSISELRLMQKEES